MPLSSSVPGAFWQSRTIPVDACAPDDGMRDRVKFGVMKSVKRIAGDQMRDRAIALPYHIPPLPVPAHHAVARAARRRGSQQAADRF